MSTRAHARFFDRWARHYQSTPFMSDYLRRVQRKAITWLGLPRGARVLDLGCGPGLGLRRLRSAGLRAVGGDLSEQMIAKARLAGPVTRLSALELPFGDGTFDGLVCTNSFHHYPDPVLALSEMRRVLRFGGRLVIVDPSGEDFFAKLVIYGGERLLFGMDDVHLHDRAEWRTLLEEAGFADVCLKRASRIDPRGRASILLKAIAG